MKKFFTLFCLLAAIIFVGCTKSDLQDFRDEISDLTEKIESLESDVSLANSQIAALQSIVAALENNDYVTDVSPLVENGVEVGYTISFSKSAPITILNGQSEAAPVVGVAADEDGNYYWTVKVDGEQATWLLGDDGEKIPTTGNDGEDGQSSEVNGTVPVISIGEYEGKTYWMIDGEWLLFYDEMVPTDGVSGSDGSDGSDGSNGSDGADGADGTDGSSNPANSVTYTDNGSTVTIKFGDTSFTFAKSSSTISFVSYDNVELTAATNTIELIMPQTLAEDGYSSISAEVIGTNNETGSATVTRSTATDGIWGVEVSKPTYNKGVWSNAVIYITKPTNYSSTEEAKAILTVSLVETGGSTVSTSVLFTFN